MPPDTTPATLDELAEAFVAEVRAGGAGDIEAYAARHPPLAERIRELFPLLGMLEGLKPPVAERTTEAEDGPPPPPIERVGPYRVVRELGRGGMGRVFEAEREDGARVALKLIHAHLVGQEGYLTRFLREVEAGRRIDDESVVRTLGSGVAEIGGSELPYLVLEFVEGQNLRELLDEISPLGDRLTRLIGARVADGLNAIHAADMVHRDIKPENVVITPDETVKLMDLGVALLQDQALRLSRTGEFVGSLLYAAPEQLQGRRADARADLYALGVLLYELAVGQHPGTTGEGGQPPVSLRLGEPPSARAANPDVSPFLDAVIRTLMAVDPERRFVSALQVAVILRLGEGGPWWQERRRAADRPRRRYERLTGFHGRAAELAALQRAYEAAAAGHGRTLLVVGDGGIGKSRLLHEWLDRIDAQADPAPHVVWATHAPGDDIEGGRSLAEALGASLGSDDLEARLEALIPDGPLVEPLAALMRGEAASFGLGAPGRAALDDGVLQVLRALAAQQPVVVVVEDLHHASVDAVEAFAALARAVGRDRLLVVATSRPSRERIVPEDLDRLAHFERIAMRGLDESASHALIQEALGAEAAGSGAITEYTRSADGNPFCLVEFARELIGQKTLSVTARAGTGAGDMTIPSAVRNLVEVRLGGLPRESRDLLEVASCCGDRFDPGLVCTAAEVPRILGLRRLHELDRTHDLLRPEGADYRFQHHLMQEVVYDELPPLLKAAYHTALGAAVEASARERASERGAGIEAACAYEIARHYLRGEEPLRAMPYVHEGLEYLYGLDEYRRTVRMAERVIELEPHLEPLQLAHAEQFAGVALLAHAGPAAALPHLQRAFDLSAEDPRSTVLTAVRSDLSACLRQEGRNGEALPIAYDAVEHARHVGDRQMEGFAHTNLALCLMAAGRLEDARDNARRGMEIAREVGNVEGEGEAAAHLGGIELELGRLDEARLLLDHAVHLAQMCGSGATESNALSIYGKLCYIEGRLDEAREMQMRLRDLGRSRGIFRQEIVALVNLTQGMADEGRWREALELAEQATALGERMGYPDALTHVHLTRGMIRQSLGEFEAAEREWRAGLAIAEDLRAPPVEVRHKHRLGPLLAWTARFDEGRALLDGALEVSRAAGAARETTQLLGAGAEWSEAKGDDQAAAQAYEACREKMGRHGFTLAISLLDLALGEALLRLERHADAEVRLRAALESARSPALAAIAARARILLGALPGGDPLPARVALGDHGGRIPAHARIRAMYLLGRATGDRALLSRAASALGELVERAPAVCREAMRTRVPLHAAILAAAPGASASS